MRLACVHKAPRLLYTETSRLSERQQDPSVFVATGYLVGGYESGRSVCSLLCANALRGLSEDGAWM